MAIGLVAKVSEVGAKAAEKVAEVKEINLQELTRNGGTLELDFGTIMTQSLESIIEMNCEATEANVMEAGGAEFRPMTVEEAKAVQEVTNMSEATLSKCTINEEGTVKLSCINEGKVNEMTNPPYVEKVVHIKDLDIMVVMPEFQEVTFEIFVPETLYMADDYEMFKYCTDQLKNALEQTPSLIEQFTPQQVEQIMNGAPRISGLTWHHAAECGRMQLVPTKLHSVCRHTGGKSIWGGGRTD